ncbi:hypothetical protein ACH5RR_008256 [Cinchona calisaya]|uniref:Acetylornithine aminotransferase n=1 Tax=Cinchona calisaya TaxID=153742 RepID=A0ABD3ACL6_9GENT
MTAFESVHYSVGIASTDNSDGSKSAANSGGTASDIGLGILTECWSPIFLTWSTKERHVMPFLSSRFLANVSEKGQHFKELLVKKLGGNAHMKEVGGLGLIIGIELDVSASPLVDACQQSGLLILIAGKGNVVRLVPPLIILEQELDIAAEVLLDCLPALDEGS